MLTAPTFTATSAGGSGKFFFTNAAPLALTKKGDARCGGAKFLCVNLRLFVTKFCMTTQNSVHENQN